MADRLSTLLHDAASTLDAPSLSAGQAMTQGRRLRQRRRARNALAGAVAAIVVIGATTAALGAWHRDGSPEPARLPDHTAYEQRGAWAAGIQVHVGNHVVEIPDAPSDHRSVFVGPISYTSVGALVPYTDLSSTEGSEAPRESVLLVTPDGDVKRLGQVGGLTADASSPVIVFTRAASEPDTWELVTRDLATGEERAVGTPWGAKDPSPVGRSGDLVVYVRDQHMVTINWRTGEPGRLTHVPEIGMTTMQSFGHGGYLTAPSRATPTSVWHLRTLPEGKLLGTFPDRGDGEVQMSPDGRFVMTGGNGSVTVYDVATEKATPLELTGSVHDYGWTPDGHVVGARGSHVAVCDPADGSCTEVGELGSERLSLGHGASDTDPMAGG